MVTITATISLLKSELWGGEAPLWCLYERAVWVDLRERLGAAELFL